MKTMKNLSAFPTLIFLLLLVLPIFTACNDDDDIKPEPTPTGYTGKDGFFVLSEGNFGAGNGSVSFFSLAQEKAYHNLYFSANQAMLGDTPYDILVFGDKAAISINNSGVVDFVSLNTMKSLGYVDGLTSPRYLAEYGNQLFVSDLSEAYIHILDKNTYTKTGTIPTGKAVEQMVIAGNDLYAACWSNFYIPGNNNVVLKIDLLQGLVTDSLVLTKEPNSLLLDGNGDLWALCSGGFMMDEAPALYRIELDNFSVEQTYTFVQGSDYPTMLRYASGQLFYLNNGSIWKMQVSDTDLPQAPLYTGGSYLYNLGIQPGGDHIVVTDAGDFSSPGQVKVLDENGQALFDFEAGVVPSRVVFN